MAEDNENDAAEGSVLYWPALYEEGQWRMGYPPDIDQETPADRVDPHAMAETVLATQERQTTQP